MTEETIVRENLMNKENYAPYCAYCLDRRSTFNEQLKQFTCVYCKWISEFPKEFINRYLNRWRNKQ